MEGCETELGKMLNLISEQINDIMHDRKIGGRNHEAFGTLEPILEESKSCFMTGDGIEVCYEKTYNEKLVQNWRDLLNQFKRFNICAVEKSGGYPEKTLLLFKPSFLKKVFKD